MVRATCAPDRLLDIVENFTVFTEEKGGRQKIVARNHQYLGVNNAIAALQGIDGQEGKLGVFWHTQGSGKSISMIFFAQKVLRTVPGNWSFVIVTDRLELDDQIYKNFAGAGVITGTQAQAQNGVELQRLLKENHRYVFTLIQKFHTERGQTYPTLSERDDIIVITDEAHRSQYDTLAMNMRQALPNARFLGFTGTPLMAGEERTRQEFGDYVSIYNFRQSIEDGATVPLYYENRIPELQLINEDLNEDMEQLLEEAALDEEQERKLEREFNRQYHLITRDDRLETVARDIVEHFMGRGHLGKAMVVSIDKATAVRMHDKVRKHWDRYLAGLRGRLKMTDDPEEQTRLNDEITYMSATDMAVVVSQSQNEIAEMAKKGLDIEPHRRRMVKEDMDGKFKDRNDPFRIVFVCAMWMTGFDVPSCSTIYLDKPMRNHTLMQTIARANRVAPGKVNGLIVDYVGVFRDLQKALAIYGTDPSGGASSGEMPVKDKTELVEQLKIAIGEARGFLEAREIDVGAFLMAHGYDRVAMKDDAVDKLLETDDIRKQFMAHAANVDRIYKAVLPDQIASEYAPFAQLMRFLAQSVRSELGQADISEVMESVEQLLDRSVATEAYVIREDGDGYDEQGLVDLSQIDFETLQRRFVEGRKNIEANRLRGQINSKLQQMARMNPTRVDYLDRFQQLIDDYNAGSMNIDEFFRQLTEFGQTVNEEDERHIREGLSEEELAVFDLLTKPEIELTESERKQVKKVARDLLNTLKAEKLVLDWRKRQQSRADVLVCIEDHLDQLPDAYDDEIFSYKVQATYQHVYEKYSVPVLSAS
jgi:type I restriction enzyme, R subunit